MWARFKDWLFVSPFASVLKVAAGAGLAAFLNELATSDIDPIWVAVGGAVLPVLINYLNPADPRYGRFTEDVP